MYRLSKVTKKMAHVYHGKKFSTWEANLQTKYFDQIARGEKTYELRPSRGKWASMHVRDHIVFSSDDGRRLEVEITKILCHNSFKRAIETVGFKKLMPDLESEEEVLEAYLEIGDYRNLEDRMVLSFKIEVCDESQTSGEPVESEAEQLRAEIVALKLENETLRRELELKRTRYER